MQGIDKLVSIRCMGLICEKRSLWTDLVFWYLVHEEKKNKPKPLLRESLQCSNTTTCDQCVCEWRNKKRAEFIIPVNPMSPNSSYIKYFFHEPSQKTSVITKHRKRNRRKTPQNHPAHNSSLLGVSQPSKPPVHASKKNN